MKVLPKFLAAGAVACAVFVGGWAFFVHSHAKATDANGTPAISLKK